MSPRNNEILNSKICFLVWMSSKNYTDKKVKPFLFACYATKELAIKCCEACSEQIDRQTSCTFHAQNDGSLEATNRYCRYIITEQWIIGQLEAQNLATQQARDTPGHQETSTTHALPSSSTTRVSNRETRNQGTVEYHIGSEEFSRQASNEAMLRLEASEDSQVVGGAESPSNEPQPKSQKPPIPTSGQSQTGQ